MVEIFDRDARRIFEFPVVHPCEDISPVTLLQSLIRISHNIFNCKTKFLGAHRRNVREINRQVSMLFVFFDEIQGHVLSNSLVPCFMKLHIIFQKIQFLLEDCTREGVRVWILMKSHFVTREFQDLIHSLSIALDILPLNSMDVSFEVKELMEMLLNQSRKAKIELDSEDETTRKRVMLVLNQFENELDPDPFIIRKILGHLNINSWASCHKEIMFLEEENRSEYPIGDENDAPLFSGLIGFLSYCRGILFEDSDMEYFHPSKGRNNNILEILSCFNPDDFRCPISLELMTDPVTISTGHTYDRVSIQKWLKSGNLLCPKTGEKLTNTDLVPNVSLRKLIQQFCAEYGVSLIKSKKNGGDLSSTILPASPANFKAIKILSEFLSLRLCYGTNYQQNKAAYEIRLLAKSNLFNRSCLIEADTIPLLIELLHSFDSVMQENAVSALLKLSKQPSGQKVIIGNQGLKSVISVLKNGMKPEAKQVAAAIIFYLSSAHLQRKMIGENKETIPALLELIKEGTSCGKKNSVIAIFALLMYHKNRQRVIAAGAIPVLLDLLTSSDRVELKTDVLAVLSILADSFDGSMELLEGSALPLILGLLKTVETNTGKEYCASILHSMCINCGSDVLGMLAKHNSLMPELYSLLTEGTPHACKMSKSLIKILQNFCERSSELVRGIRREQLVNVR